jgi:restriction system protein
MSVPSFEQIMLPFLRCLEDGGEQSARAVRECVAQRLELTEDDLRALQPSGGAKLFPNRFHWARIYLDRAGVIQTPRYGWYRLTDRGRQLLRSSPKSVDTEVLMQFPEFKQFIETESSAVKSTIPAKSTPQSPTAPRAEAARGTPDELFEKAYSDLRNTTERELLERLLSASPSFFEETVIRLLVSMGYGGSFPDAAKAIGRSGDGGIDGMIKQDPLGLEVVYVQAKRWQGSVGRPAIQAFVGSLESMKSAKGVFITTSSFTREAREYISTISRRVILIDGSLLSALLYEHGVGTVSTGSYQRKRVDADYFVEE